MASKSVYPLAAEIRRRLPGVGDVKMHKLLYYAQGHFLAVYGRPLFNETISAWDMGPVVGNLWKRDADGVQELFDQDLDEAELNTIGYVLSRYGGLSGRELIRLSHGEDPWLAANQGRRRGTSVPISLEAIRQYFLNATEREEQDVAPVDAQALKELVSEAEMRLAQTAVADTYDGLLARRASLSK